MGLHVLLFLSERNHPTQSFCPLFVSSYLQRGKFISQIFFITVSPFFPMPLQHFSHTVLWIFLKKRKKNLQHVLRLLLVICTARESWDTHSPLPPILTSFSTVFYLSPSLSSSPISMYGIKCLFSIALSTRHISALCPLRV